MTRMRRTRPSADPSVFGPPEDLQRPITFAYPAGEQYCPYHDIRWFGDNPCFACEAEVPPVRELDGDKDR